MKDGVQHSGKSRPTDPRGESTLQPIAPVQVVEGAHESGLSAALGAALEQKAKDTASRESVSDAQAPTTCEVLLGYSRTISLLVCLHHSMCMSWVVRNACVHQGSKPYYFAIVE